MGKTTVFLGALVLLVFTSVASVADVMACDAALEPPAIHVFLSETSVKFDMSRSMGRLSQMKLDSNEPLYPLSSNAGVSGVMDGEIHVDHALKFGEKRRGKKGCVFLKDVNVTLSIRPTVYIAHDFQEQACQFKRVFIHEAKHVAVDKVLIIKYKKLFSEGLNMILTEEADYSSGWIDESALSGAQNEIHQSLWLALDVLLEQMLRERKEKQQDVDSAHEYIRVGGAC